MRDKTVTLAYYRRLGFAQVGTADYADYLMIGLDSIELHFFRHHQLDPDENYGQLYVRTDAIDKLYQSLLDQNVPIHPAGHLQIKPWGQKEFAVLDPDNNLLTFGQSL